MISIYEDNYAFYDPKENKIKFGYNDRVGSMCVPEEKTLTDLCITESYLSFILDKTHFVRGKLQGLIFESVDTLPEGKTWNRVLYISKVKKFLLIAGEDMTEKFEVFCETGGPDCLSGTFINVSPSQENIVNRVPERDLESIAFVVAKPYMGFYDHEKMTFVWQKVDLLCEKIFNFAIGHKSIFYTVITGEYEHMPIMSLHKADIQKLFNRESDATQLIIEGCSTIASIHTFNDALIIQSFSKNIIIHKNEDSKAIGSHAVLKLDEDDFLVYMSGFKNNVLYQTAKGHVFKVVFNEDLISGFKYVQEIA